MPVPVVDLRSDTLTRPTLAMRRAMAEAEVGDDVYGEDPTVNALEARTAALFGHEAGLFVPSGTMGNQLGLRLLVAPGDELFCDADAHVVTYEHGAAAHYGSISTRTSVNHRGLLDPDQVAEQIRPGGYTVPTRAVAVEQTHNRGGGAVYPLPTLQALRTLTTERGVGLHCDGARIWNAAVASGTPLAEYGACFDTLSVCLSKGLGAPVGSVLVGSAADIARARPMRKGLGGGMRQAGILAAAGLYALDHHLDRLAEDHRRARTLAERVAAVRPEAVDPATVETNLVSLDVAATGLDVGAVHAAAADAGVLVGRVDARRLRAVTHLDADDAACDRAAEVLCGLLA